MEEKYTVNISWGDNEKIRHGVDIRIEMNIAEKIIKQGIFIIFHFSMNVIWYIDTVDQ